MSAAESHERVVVAAAAANGSPACGDRLRFAWKVFKVTVEADRIRDALPELVTRRRELSLRGDGAGTDGLVGDTPDDGAEEESDEDLVVHPALLSLPARGQAPATTGEQDYE